MALEEQVGAIVLEVDGQDIDVLRLSTNETTGRTLVRSMNRTGEPAGFTKGVKEYSLDLSCSIPKGGEPIDWAGIEDAKLTITPQGGGPRTSYLGCFTTRVGRQFQAEGAAGIEISMQATRKVNE